MTLRHPFASLPARQLRAPRRLQTRFRIAAFLLVLPLVGLAAVSAIGLADSTTAAANVREDEQQQSQIDRLHEHVQDAALTQTEFLATHRGDEAAAMATAANQVDNDLTALASTPTLSTDEAAAVRATSATWTAVAALRHAVWQSAGISPLAITTLDDEVAQSLGATVSRLHVLELLNDSQLAALRLSSDAALRTSAIAVFVGLVLGLVGAAWLSRRLALSILEPLGRLRLAAGRLASGESTHRVASGTGDELGELGDAFNVMAERLDERQEEVRARERRLAALVENSSDGILVIDAAGAIVFATPRFSDHFFDDSVATTQLAEMIHPDDRERTGAAWARALAGSDGATCEVEARLKRIDGSWRHVWAKLTNRVSDPAVRGVVLNVSDVSERHEHEQQLTFQALHDPLTRLGNRDLFQHRLERALVSGKSAGSSTSVLYIDLDEFKRINDALGHDAGDGFLVAVAERLVAAVRPQDMVARLGGDEFAVLLEATDGAAAVTAAERMLHELMAPMLLAGQEMTAGASVGVASALPVATSPETLLADADLAMYFAKRHGKGRCQVLTPTMRTDLLDRLQLGQDLRAALEGGGLSVNCQPVVDMQTGAVVGAEALARWEHPTRGWVGPVTFIPIAEELNLVERIDRWILREACRQGRAWADAGLPSLRMAVNLSGSNLEAPDLVAAVAATLLETGFPAENLELELTEGVAIVESAAARATLEELKALGLHLAIDDFGTGYSALARLRALPFDTLKVDKTFVDELDGATNGSTLAETILDMARVLGLQVVAEGVETTSQAEFLRQRNCDFAQGYLFSRPVDAAAFGSLLASASTLGQDQTVRRASA